VVDAALIEALFVFGDSLSDAGNAAALSGDTFPPSPPYARRFSNVPVAAEYLATALGVPLLPSVAGGTDFAVGGATTGTANFDFVVSQPFPLPPVFENTGMAVQVGGFSDSFDPARSLFMLWGGANDIFLALALGQDPAAAVGTAVTNLAGEVGALAGLGARRFLVPNLPDLGAVPFAATLSPAEAAGLTALSEGFGAGLAQALSLVEAQLLGLGIDIDVELVDVLAAQREIMANPAAFGFTNVTSPCLADPSAFAAGCKGFLFFDDVHPTTAGHRILGREFRAAVPVPATVLLLAAGMVSLLLQSRSRKPR
jgi:phospholipase/lecithinase/hemolysin